MLECDEVEEDSLSIVSNTSFVRKFVGSLITGSIRDFSILAHRVVMHPWWLTIFLLHAYSIFEVAALRYL